MSTILDKIVVNKRIEVEAEKANCSLSALESKIANRSFYTSLKDSIKQSKTGIIAEFKRKSPSKDWIFKDAKVENIVPYYSLVGAAGISILTDTEFFGGNLCDLERGVRLTTTPILRKDFIVDEFQILQAAASGTSAILLIAASLSKDETLQFAKRAKELKLDVLLEVHNEDELGHINPYVDIVGVNNRNLKTFETKIETSIQLYDKIPNEFVKISESGISSTDVVLQLIKKGYQGFLMGENFMKTSNPGHALSTFINTLEKELCK